MTTGLLIVWFLGAVLGLAGVALSGEEVTDEGRPWLVGIIAAWPLSLALGLIAAAVMFVLEMATAEREVRRRKQTEPDTDDSVPF